MSEKFTIEIISPDRLILKKDVSEVVLPSFEGEMGILKDHIPLITFLRPGLIKIVEETEKILFVEDDQKKIDDVKAHFSSRTNFELSIRGSYQSGLRLLLKEDFDLLLLDMSLPMWDNEQTSTVGSFKKFGGYMLLNEIVRKNRPLSTIVFTMFDDFGESDNSLSLKELDGHLVKDFGEIYLGAVFYSSKADVWQEELDVLINKLRS